MALHTRHHFASVDRIRDEVDDAALETADFRLDVRRSPEHHDGNVFGGPMAGERERIAARQIGVQQDDVTVTRTRPVTVMSAENVVTAVAQQDLEAGSEWFGGVSEQHLPAGDLGQGAGGERHPRDCNGTAARAYQSRDAAISRT